MNTRNLRIAMVWLGLGVSVSLAVGLAAEDRLPGAGAQTQSIDPVAVRILENMAEFVSGLEQFSVHTENTYEDQLDSGQRIDLDITSDVTVRRPDKLRASRTGELTSQDFYYDGKTLALYNASSNLYASQPAPRTVEELLDYAREDLGVIVPASDLAYRNVFAILMQGVTSAVVLGKTRIEGVICEHLAFSRPDIDFQIWIAEGDRPLPCKYVVTDTSTPELISTVSVMTDWNLDPNTPDSAFEFIPPKGAQAISFMPIDKTDAAMRAQEQ